jgi:hypothetical protein
MVKKEHQAATGVLERRAEPRVRAGLSVLLKTPDAHPMEACLLDVSPSGARLRVPEPVLVGANVRIEAHELLLLGTVKRCCLTQGTHEVGVALSRPLEMLDELRQLNAALLAESEPTENVSWKIAI